MARGRNRRWFMIHNRPRTLGHVFSQAQADFGVQGGVVHGPSDRTGD